MLHGKAVIELTNLKTEEKERYEEENIITNAVPDILGLNPSGLMYPLQNTAGSMFSDEIFPIGAKCYGGILLFENPLEENINNIIPPSDNPIIGYGSNDVSPSASSLRGSANQIETTPLENGYKLVWDFSTSQGNGRISSIALTHYKGGSNYYGDEYNRKACLLLNSTSLELSKELQRIYVGMVEGDPETNEFISFWPRENKTLEIVKFKESYSSVGLSDSIIGPKFQEINKITINLEEYYGSIRNWEKGGFYDGKDGYWYGFINESSRDGDLLRKIKINKDDFSTQVDEWKLDGVKLYDLSRYPSNDSSNVYRRIGSVIKDGYLYGINSERNKIAKININNPVDVSLIDLGFKSDFASGSDTSSYLYKWGDHILGYDFAITKDDKIIRHNKGSSLKDVCTPTVEMGPFRIGYSADYNRVRKHLYLHTPYLGTINNLPSPILKTADKTMKITYTLTEVEDENE